MKKSFLQILDRVLSTVPTVAKFQSKDEIAAQKPFFLIRKDSDAKFGDQKYFSTPPTPPL